MHILTDKILNSILLSMETCDGTISPYKEALLQRLYFFYSLIIESLIDTNDVKNLKQVIKEITDFEIFELAYSIHYADDFTDMTTELTLQNFSILAYRLACCRINGNSYSSLAFLMRELYRGFLGDTAFDDEIKHEYEEIIADTFLDLSFASNQSEIISLRLLHYRDSI